MTTDHGDALVISQASAPSTAMTASVRQEILGSLTGSS
jgi:hypothetical protein